MIRRQIIGTLLTLIVLSGLFGLLILKNNNYALGLSPFTIEIFCYFIGVSVFLIVLIIGGVVFRKKNKAYWGLSWSVISLFSGLLSLWALVLSMNPTQNEWAGLIQMITYYLIGCLLSQTAVLIAFLAFYTIQQMKKRQLLLIILFCGVLDLAFVILYIVCGITMYFKDIEIYRRILFGTLPNTIPLCIAIPLIWIILREKKAHNIRELKGSGTFSDLPLLLKA